MIQIFKTKDKMLYQLSNHNFLLNFFPLTTNCLKVDPDERCFNEDILFSKEDWERIRNRQFDPPFKPLNYLSQDIDQNNNDISEILNNKYEDNAENDDLNPSNFLYFNKSYFD
jgi:hypothetical protein